MDRRIVEVLEIVLCSLVFTAGACVLLDRPGGREYRELRNTQSNDNTQLIRRFENYPVDKQIDIFLYSDDPRFAPILVSEGEIVIPGIVGRIETENHVWNKVRLIDVLREINKQCRCINSASEYLQRLKSVSEDLENSSKYESDPTYQKMFSDAVVNLENQR